MANTAAVYIEATNSSIFVGTDGHAARMLPTLTSFVQSGKAEALAAAGNDFFVIGAEATLPTGFSGGELVPGVGVLYSTQTEPLHMEWNDRHSIPVFYEQNGTPVNVDYKYIIKPDGSVQVFDER